MVRVLGAVLMLVTITTSAHAEEPRSRAAGVRATTEPAGAPPASSTPPAIDADSSRSCGAPPSDAAAEERAFASELERFARLRAFTARLMAKREADAFEQAALRQARVTQLKRELTEREVAMSEREFDEAVTLYLKKRQLTRELAVAASRAKAAPAGSTSGQPTPLAPTPP